MEENSEKIKPLVSAIVSTYNSEKFIRGKLEDLLGQTIVDDLEILVINSGSQQNEDKIITEYLGKYGNIKYIRTEQRETIYKAWNRGIKSAEGSFITNANTDDRLRKDAYEILSKTLINNPDTALIYADQYLSNFENQKYEDSLNNRIIKFPNYEHIYQLERCIIGSQPMWRASLHFTDNIWFSEKYEISGDHEFELRISEKYKIMHLAIPLGVFYKSSEKTNKETQDPIRMVEEVREITNNYLLKYIALTSKEKLTEIQRNMRIFLLLPLVIYEFLVRSEKFFSTNIYPTLFKHSIEFVYYFNILIYLKLGQKNNAIKLCKKYLKYKKSERIKRKYVEISINES
jgi:glycosyltransferase involved in cell wall biosynthesis